MGTEATDADTMTFLTTQGTSNGGTLDGHFLFRTRTRLMTKFVALEGRQ